MVKKLLRGGDIPQHLSIPLRLIKKSIFNSNKIRVLDIGGGYGDNYHLLKKELSVQAGQLSFTVVDNQGSCSLGEQLFSSSDEVSFRDTMPENYYDLILIIGTLQYIRDWREFLSELARRKPKFVFVARTPIRVFGPSFLTMQSVCPAFGFEALTKVGEANVSVVSAEELQELMLLNGYLLKEKRFNSDYSKQFARLPKHYQNVVYIDWLWERSATA